MYRLAFDRRKEPQRFWNLPDRVFFACGACHILAYAFLERYRSPRHKAIWIRPAAGFSGNHIFVSDENWVFDFHGYSCRERLLAHTFANARRWQPGWDATLAAMS